VVGVPDIIPVPAAKLNPAGKVPTVIDQLNGAVPPLDARVWLYPAPTVPPGRLVVVTTNCGLITIDKA
jgi:hypothetical protein